MIIQIYEYFINNFVFFSTLILDHIKITIITALISSFIGIFLGIYISEYRRIAKYIISIVNILYTIPSIALLGIFISITGIGNLTAIIALVIYALLPIVRSTYIGIINIDDKIIEASEAMGSRKIDVLCKIKIPLAFPIIFSAIRNMFVMTIALAGIASFVGAGGLGVAIYRGITTNNKTLLILGSILIALLALLFDFLLSIFEKFYIKKRRKINWKKLSFLIIIPISIFTIYLFNTGENKSINIASKPVTEGYILAEITSNLIEENSDIKVKITHGVGGGTSNIHPAIIRGDFDIYPEYTGTAWQVVLKEKDIYSEDLFDKLNKEYENKFKLTWKSMFGFNDTYGIGIRKEIADKYNIKTYSDLSKYSKELIFGAEYDFFEREDGFKSLTKAYNLEFLKTVDMDNGLKYNALFNKSIDVMTVFTTDGQVSDSRITLLEDDLNFYPSYRAGLVVREDILEKYPELNSILAKLDNILDELTMAKLNYEVEINKKDPRDVARKFLIEKGLIK